MKKKILSIKQSHTIVHFENTNIDKIIKEMPIELLK